VKALEECRSEAAIRQNATVLLPLPKATVHRSLPKDSSEREHVSPLLGLARAIMVVQPFRYMVAYLWRLPGPGMRPAEGVKPPMPAPCDQRPTRATSLRPHVTMRTRYVERHVLVPIQGLLWMWKTEPRWPRERRRKEDSPCSLLNSTIGRPSKRDEGLEVGLRCLPVARRPSRALGPTTTTCPRDPS
jgi:hypothetical protein